MAATYPPARGSIVGFTASREEPTDQQAEIIVAALAPLWKMRGFITGACIGGDHRIATWLASVYTSTPQMVVVPADRSRIARWWDQPQWQPGVMLVEPSFDCPKIHIREMPPGTSYAERNDVIVDSCDVLVAFPRFDDGTPRTRRSGSWMTIRKALTAGREVHIFPLDGSVPEHFPASTASPPAR